MTSKKETGIRNKIKKYLNSIPGCKVWVNHGSMFSEAGRPDLTGFISFDINCSLDISSIGIKNVPVFIALEIKQPGQEAKPHQIVKIQEMRGKGAHVAIVTSVEETKEFIDEIKKYYI